MRKILMCICDYRENQSKERQDNKMDINKITFMRVLSKHQSI
jgi:hypothetical protein